MAGFSPKDLGTYQPPGYEEVGFAFLFIFRSECWYQKQRAKWIDGRGNVLFRSLEVIEDNDCPLTQEELEACFPVRKRAWRLLRNWLAVGRVRAVSVNDLGDVTSVPSGFWRTHQGLEALENGMAASSLHGVSGAVFVNEIDLYDAATDHSVGMNTITDYDELLAAGREPREPLRLVEPSSVGLIEDASSEKRRGRPPAADMAVFVAEVAWQMFDPGPPPPEQRQAFRDRVRDGYLQTTGVRLNDDWIRRHVAVLWKRWEDYRSGGDGTPPRR